MAEAWVSCRDFAGLSFQRMCTDPRQPCIRRIWCRPEWRTLTKIVSTNYKDSIHYRMRLRKGRVDCFLCIELIVHRGDSSDLLLCTRGGSSIALYATIDTDTFPLQSDPRVTNPGVLSIRWDLRVRGAHPLGFVRGQTVLVADL